MDIFSSFESRRLFRIETACIMALGFRVTVEGGHGMLERLRKGRRRSSDIIEFLEGIHNRLLYLSPTSVLILIREHKTWDRQFLMGMTEMVRRKRKPVKEIWAETQIIMTQE